MLTLVLNELNPINEKYIENWNFRQKKIQNNLYQFNNLGMQIIP